MENSEKFKTFVSEKEKEMEDKEKTMMEANQAKENEYKEFSKMMEEKQE